MKTSTILIDFTSDWLSREYVCECDREGGGESITLYYLLFKGDASQNVQEVGIKTC